MTPRYPGVGRGSRDRQGRCQKTKFIEDLNGAVLIEGQRWSGDWMGLRYFEPDDLGWFGVGLSYAISCIWFGSFTLSMTGYINSSRWFQLSVETFDAIQERGLRVFKIGIIYLTWRCWSHS